MQIYLDHNYVDYQQQAFFKLLINMFEQMSNLVNPKYRLFNKMFKHIVYNRFLFFLFVL